MTFNNSQRRRRHDHCHNLRIGFLLLLLISTLEGGYASGDDNHNMTHSPSLAPTTNATTTTPAPSPHTTEKPSQSPTRKYPTLAPSVHRNTSAPTPAEHVPTLAPSPSAIVTPAPTPYPTETPSVPTVTTSAPSSSPPAPSKKGVSIWRILGKTLGWLILIALSVLLFGAIMSNRYQIYYYFKATVRYIRRMECTRWILHTTRLSRFFGDDYDAGGGSLNEVIFDRGDLTEGLLMTGEDQS